MRKTQVMKTVPEKRCLNCGRDKALSKSYYCETCRESLLRKKLREF